MSELFPGWKEKYVEGNPLHGLPLRLQNLHTRHGSKSGETCGGCRFLLAVTRGNTTVFKCAKHRDTRSTATDWRKKWPACGLWEEVPAVPAREPAR